MADLRTAIIGYGLAGRIFHAPLIDSAPGLNLSSVVTANPERQAQVAREYPRARVLTEVRELWQRAGEHDLIVVATPNHTHASLARAAIERGLAVVVDKPLAPNAAEAQALVAAARTAGVTLTVFHNRRWDSDQLTLVRLMAEGRLGEVVRYESRLERWRPQATGAWRDSVSPERGGGQLLDLGSHLVDQALLLFGAVTHVYAEVDARRGGVSDDDAFMALRHAGGVISHLHASAVAAGPGPRLRVLGSGAAFVVQEPDGQEDALRAGQRPGSGAWGHVPQLRWGRLLRGQESEPVPAESGAWPHFYAALAEALRAGGKPPVCAQDAVRTLAVLDAARRSANSRSVITLS